MEKEEIEKRAKELVKQEESKKNELPSTKVKTKIDLNDLNNQYLQTQIDNGKNITDITREYAKAEATSSLLKNEENKRFRDELVNKSKKSLKESFIQENIEEATKTINAKRKKAEAFYMSVRPILEFDFSNLIKTKKKKDEDLSEKKITYEDRSYGRFLMTIMLLVLIVPYFVTTVVLALFNGINSILEEIWSFQRVAKYIALGIFVIVLMVIAIYLLLLGIDHFFGTTILSTYL